MVCLTAWPDLPGIAWPVCQDRHDMTWFAVCVCECCREKVEVVLLQEVVPGNEAVLREALREYTVVCGGTGSKDGYYTAILLHKHHCLLDDCTIVPFCSSQMGRNLMLVSVSVPSTSATEPPLLQLYPHCSAE